MILVTTRLTGEARGRLFASKQENGPAWSGGDVDRIKEKYRSQVEYYALPLSASPANR